jgi:hypothetical protein
VAASGSYSPRSRYGGLWLDSARAPTACIAPGSKRPTVRSIADAKDRLVTSECILGVISPGSGNFGACVCMCVHVCACVCMCAHERLSQFSIGNSGWFELASR